MTHRFSFLAAVILVPAFILAALAWRGLQAQRRAAWADKRKEAQRILVSEANDAARLLQERFAIPLVDFPDPPTPQASDIGTQRLQAATTIDAMRALRDDTNAGLTSAGLPVRTLAAAKLLEQEAAQANADALLSLALHDAPSVLTPMLLASAEQHGATFPSPWRTSWQHIEQARAIASRHPDADHTWAKDEQAFWWLDRQSKTALRLANPLQDLTTRISTSFPPWAKLRIRIAGLQDFHDEPLAQRSVPEFPGLSLQVIAPDPSLIEGSVRNQERWAMAMVGSSLFTAVLGLWLIHRTLARERKLGEMKSQFVASVSHELRAPVASIRLMADALDQQKVAPETAAEFHRLISGESKRLSHLIENVLDFARIEQGRKRWHFEACDLASLVSDTVKVMQPLADEKSITLTLSNNLADVEPVIDADAIQQALINLLDNAIKFSPENTTVAISLSADTSTLRLAVRDQGPGIPAAEHARIFERFYRPGDELRRETQGTGIGLSLVKAIAEAHGGEVLLESQPGHGSTFTLQFPSQPVA